MSKKYQPTKNIHRKLIMNECRNKADEIITTLSTEVPNFQILKELDKYVYLKVLLELALSHETYSNFMLYPEILRASRELPVLDFIQIISTREMNENAQ